MSLFHQESFNSGLTIHLPNNTLFDSCKFVLYFFMNVFAINKKTIIEKKKELIIVQCLGVVLEDTNLKGGYVK